MSSVPSLPPPSTDPVAPDWYAYVVLVVLTCLSRIFSGLNLGLMSLTVEDLNIVLRSSDDPRQIAHAKKILPLRKRGNLLLCTLLIGNTVVNVMLSVRHRHRSKSLATRAAAAEVPSCSVSRAGR